MADLEPGHNSQGAGLPVIPPSAGHEDNDCESHLSDREWAIAKPVHGETHPMRQNLRTYVLSKIHQLVRSKTWTEIRVIGKHERCEPYIISNREKHSKRFNWFRPTAKVVNNDVLEISCFPGTAYVKHYAVLIATYLNIQGVSPTIVRYEVSVDTARSVELLSKSMLGLGTIDTVIVGYVEQLEDICPGTWQSSSNDTNELLYWKSSLIGNGQRIVLLGCMVSFWGDISASLIQCLSRHGLKSFIYIGKAAALQPQRQPNRVIASGGSSYVAGSHIRWDSALRDVVRSSITIVQGGHSNVLSPLLDDRHWLSERREQKDEWIDCEIGLMATACEKLQVSFAYLHIVSDNVSVEQETGLWNEDESEVRKDRMLLLQEIGKVLRSYLNGRSSEMVMELDKVP